ncbi:hypothetical protein SAMD00019534_119330 [Acytostelium subglobosum LB1]|uniref:hypothetical protein n=1 Tax=Acytostelium subglobosum LB1 TaxID=1410327 RepID=UPI0006448648|nr:hypothetical protein SAMD00019534_119330 [Acytostelium subglobosum LB1]GAM28757.1 hypothetical protein SAMD00019534_119330 [Acytostelium subglobosum LB1]|eukprot:XP_012748312.1 hypothetical protein SAMD00019534_119330 [Acytostelium subglobosum LB1]
MDDISRQLQTTSISTSSSNFSLLMSHDERIRQNISQLTRWLSIESNVGTLLYRDKLINIIKQYLKLESPLNEELDQCNQWLTKEKSTILKSSQQQQQTQQQIREVLQSLELNIEYCIKRKLYPDAALLLSEAIVQHPDHIHFTILYLELMITQANYSEFFLIISPTDDNSHQRISVERYHNNLRYWEFIHKHLQQLWSTMEPEFKTATLRNAPYVSQVLTDAKMEFVRFHLLLVESFDRVIRLLLASPLDQAVYSRVKVELESFQDKVLALESDISRYLHYTNQQQQQQVVIDDLSTDRYTTAINLFKTRYHYYCGLIKDYQIFNQSFDPKQGYPFTDYFEAFQNRSSLEMRQTYAEIARQLLFSLRHIDHKKHFLQYFKGIKAAAAASADNNTNSNTEYFEHLYKQGAVLDENHIEKHLIADIEMNDLRLLQQSPNDLARFVDYSLWHLKRVSNNYSILIKWLELLFQPFITRLAETTTGERGVEPVTLSNILVFVVGLIFEADETLKQTYQSSPSDLRVFVDQHELLHTTTAADFNVKLWRSMVVHAQPLRTSQSNINNNTSSIISTPSKLLTIKFKTTPIKIHQTTTQQQQQQQQQKADLSLFALQVELNNVLANGECLSLDISHRVAEALPYLLSSQPDYKSMDIPSIQIKLYTRSLQSKRLSKVTMDNIHLALGTLYKDRRVFKQALSHFVKSDTPAANIETVRVSLDIITFNISNPAYTKEIFKSLMQRASQYLNKCQNYNIKDLESHKVDYSQYLDQIQEYREELMQLQDKLQMEPSFNDSWSNLSNASSLILPSPFKTPIRTTSPLAIKNISDEHQQQQQSPFKPIGGRGSYQRGDRRDVQELVKRQLMYNEKFESLVPTPSSLLSGTSETGSNARSVPISFALGEDIKTQSFKPQMTFPSTTQVTTPTSSVPPTPSKQSQTPVKVMPQPTLKAGEWMCRSCQQIGKDSELDCTLCHAPNPSPKTSTPSLFSATPPTTTPTQSSSLFNIATPTPSTTGGFNMFNTQQQQQSTLTTPSTTSSLFNLNPNPTSTYTAQSLFSTSSQATTSTSLPTTGGIMFNLTPSVPAGGFNPTVAPTTSTPNSGFTLNSSSNTSNLIVPDRLGEQTSPVTTTATATATPVTNLFNPSTTTVAPTTVPTSGFTFNQNTPTSGFTPNQTSSNTSSLFPQSSIKDDQWKCPACEAVNKLTDRLCNVCQIPNKNATKATTSPLVPSTTAPVTNLFNPTTPTSGFTLNLNTPSSSTTGSNLFQTSPFAPTTTSPTSTTGFTFNPTATTSFPGQTQATKEGGWKCQCCDQSNESTDKLCKLCQVAKPTPKVAKDPATPVQPKVVVGPDTNAPALFPPTTATSSTSTSLGFTFNPTLNATPPASLFPDQSATLKPGQWKCKCCEVANDDSARLCKDCQVPRQPVPPPPKSTPSPSVPVEDNKLAPGWQIDISDDDDEEDDEEEEDEDDEESEDNEVDQVVGDVSKDSEDEEEEEEDDEEDNEDDEDDQEEEDEHDEEDEEEEEEEEEEPEEDVNRPIAPISFGSLDAVPNTTAPPPPPPPMVQGNKPSSVFAPRQTATVPNVPAGQSIFSTNFNTSTTPPTSVFSTSSSTPSVFAQPTPSIFASPATSGQQPTSVFDMNKSPASIFGPSSSTANTVATPTSIFAPAVSSASPTPSSSVFSPSKAVTSPPNLFAPSTSGLTTAPSPSIFGPTTTTTQTTGSSQSIFALPTSGSTASQTPSAVSNPPSLFTLPTSTAAGTNPPSTQSISSPPNLFGTTTTTTTTTQSSSSPSQQAQTSGQPTQSTPGLFGSAPTSSTSVQGITPTTSLFGSASTSSPSATQGAVPPTSLFGSAPISSPLPGHLGVPGAANAPPQVNIGSTSPAPQVTSPPINIFGSSSTSNNNTTSTSLFGGPPASEPTLFTPPSKESGNQDTDKTASTESTSVTSSEIVKDAEAMTKDTVVPTSPAKVETFGSLNLSLEEDDDVDEDEEEDEDDTNDDEDNDDDQNDDDPTTNEKVDDVDVSFIATGQTVAPSSIQFGSIGATPSTSTSTSQDEPPKPIMGHVKTSSVFAQQQKSVFSLPNLGVSIYSTKTHPTSVFNQQPAAASSSTSVFATGGSAQPHSLALITAPTSIFAQASTSSAAPTTSSASVFGNTNKPNPEPSIFASNSVFGTPPATTTHATPEPLHSQEVNTPQQQVQETVESTDVLTTVPTPTPCDTLSFDSSSLLATTNQPTTNDDDVDTDDESDVQTTSTSSTTTTSVPIMFASSGFSFKPNNSSLDTGSSQWGGASSSNQSWMSSNEKPVTSSMFGGHGFGQTTQTPLFSSSTGPVSTGHVFGSSSTQASSQTFNQLTTDSSSSTEMSTTSASTSQDEQPVVQQPAPITEEPKAIEEVASQSVPTEQQTEVEEPTAATVVEEIQPAETVDEQPTTDVEKQPEEEEDEKVEPPVFEQSVVVSEQPTEEPKAMEEVAMQSVSTEQQTEVEEPATDVEDIPPAETVDEQPATNVERQTEEDDEKVEPPVVEQPVVSEQPDDTVPTEEPKAMEEVAPESVPAEQQTEVDEPATEVDVKPEEEDKKEENEEKAVPTSSLEHSTEGKHTTVNDDTIQQATEHSEEPANDDQQQQPEEEEKKHEEKTTETESENKNDEAAGTTSTSSPFFAQPTFVPPIESESESSTKNNQDNTASVFDSNNKEDGPWTSNPLAPTNQEDGLDDTISLGKTNTTINLPTTSNDGEEGQSNE